MKWASWANPQAAEAGSTAAPFPFQAARSKMSSRNFSYNLNILNTFKHCSLIASNHLILILSRFVMCQGDKGGSQVADRMGYFPENRVHPSKIMRSGQNAVDSIQYCSKAWRLANLARLVLALRIVYQDVKAWIHCQRIAGAGMGLAEVLNFPHLSQPAQANHSYLLKIATPVSAHVPTWTWSPAACSHYPALVQTVPSNGSAKR